MQTKRTLQEQLVDAGLIAGNQSPAEKSLDTIRQLDQQAIGGKSASAVEFVSRLSHTTDKT